MINNFYRKGNKMNKQIIKETVKGCIEKIISEAKLPRSLVGEDIFLLINYILQGLNDQQYKRMAEEQKGLEVAIEYETDRKGYNAAVKEAKDAELKLSQYVKQKFGKMSDEEIIRGISQSKHLGTVIRFTKEVKSEVEQLKIVRDITKTKKFHKSLSDFNKSNRVIFK